MKKKHRILIVEDAALVAADIEECLESLGYEVCDVVPTGEEAIEACTREKPDLVMMDIVLDGEMDGVEAAQRIRAEINLPVVFLTAHADEATLGRALVTEPYGYIVKPFEQVEIRTALELAIYRHQAERDRQFDDKTKERTSDLAKKLLNRFARSTNSNEEKEEIRDFLRQISPFKQLDNDTLNAMVEISRLHSLDVGQYLAFEGEEDVPGFVVKTGRIALVKSSANGRDLVVELLVPGDPLGLLITTGKTPYPVTAEARVRSTLVVFPREALLAVIDSFTDLGKELIEQVFLRLRDAHNTARGLAHDRVEVRVASALLTLRDRLATNGSSPENSIPLTRQELADLIGSTPETVTRVCRAFEKQGVVSLPKSGLIQIVEAEELELLLSKA